MIVSAVQGLQRLARERYRVLVGRASGERSVPMPSPRLGYHADPFLVVRGGELRIFCEYFDALADRGRIVTFALHPDTLQAGPARVVMAPRHHVSYPFVFEHEGRLYLVPETHATRSVDLFECVSYPDRFRFVRRLLDDVDAADSNLLAHDGRLWLFTSVRDDPEQPRQRRLAIFSTEDLLRGDLAPHPVNALRLYEDQPNSGGRCGGPFFRAGGALVRPSQDNPRHYGERMVFREIVRLTRDAFEERAVGTAPFHHYARVGDLFVADVRDRVPG